MTCLYQEKDVFIHAPDFKEYTKKERDLYFKPEELPFPVSHNTEGLVRNIINISHGEYSDKLKSFSRMVNMYESGRASDTLTEIIRERINR